MPARPPVLNRSIGSILTAENLQFLEGLQRQFEADPASVDRSWHMALALLSEAGAVERTDPSAMADRARDIIRDIGHQFASVNPLAEAPETDAIASEICRLTGLPAIHASAMPLLSLYCGPLAIETGHIDDYARRKLIHRLVEDYEMQDPDWAGWAELIVRVTEFERLMGTKFTAKKRFGSEGGEAIVLLVQRILERLAGSGVTRVVVGTMHRGRLSLMTNVFGRPLDLTLAEFKGMHPFGDARAADVPYHLGWEGTLLFGDRNLDIEVFPNPSHLEAVNASVLGKTRGHQDNGEKTAALILHTDGAVIAQGVVSETIQLSETAAYGTGGTIHVVINNQISFTTEPHEARSSRNCTGAWKAVDSLILRTNSEDLGAIVKAADLAVGYRTQTRADSVIDFVCYRRNGHNEIDEPRFTQPRLYEAIAARKPLSEQLGALGRAGISAAFVATAAATYRAEFDAAYARAQQIAEKRASTPAERMAVTTAEVPETGLPRTELLAAVEAQSQLPEGVFDAKLEKLVHGRGAAKQTGVTWALAEALAFSATVSQGMHVRLSGQDVARGAFSHRHYKPIDLRTGGKIDLINVPGSNRPLFEVVNSPLSEYAVLGFEYGYSLARPNGLTIWEAQFGDFANGAQIVIDQFIAASEEKWALASPLVLLLPHGLDGQGPEHSSGRIERFLQLAAPHNFTIALPSTPANYFHLMRRHVASGVLKPLVIFGAKALIRHPRATSPIEDFERGTGFQPVIAHASPATTKLVFCSGKLAYDLEAEIAKRGSDEVTVVRIEQLWPFPSAQVAAVLSASPDAAVAFVQEEPANMGSLATLVPLLQQEMQRLGRDADNLDVIARPASGSPAGSFHGRHDADQHDLVERALRTVRRTNLEKPQFTSIRETA